MSNIKEKDIKNALNYGDWEKVQGLLEEMDIPSFEKLSVYIRRRLAQACLSGYYKELKTEELLLVGRFIKESRLWKAAKEIDAQWLLCLIRACRPNLSMLDAVADLSMDEECRAILINYREEHFTEGSLSHREDVLFEKEIGITEATAKDLRTLYRFRKYPDGMHIAAYHGSEDVLILPDYYKMYPVTALSRKAFSKSPVRQIVIQDGIRKIEKDCFLGCELLDTITLPDSIECIEGKLFSDTRMEANIFRASGREVTGTDTVLRCSEKVFELLDPSDRMMMIRALFAGKKNLEEDMKVTIGQYIKDNWLKVFEQILEEDWQSGLRSLIKGYAPDVYNAEDAWDEAVRRFAMSQAYYETTVRSLSSFVSPLIDSMYQPGLFEQLHLVYQKELALYYLATELNFGCRQEAVEKWVLEHEELINQELDKLKGQDIAARMNENGKMFH